MQFTCQSLDMKYAVDIVTRAIPARPAMPEYGCILMTAKGSGVTLRATNGTLNMTAFFPAQVSADGEIAVDGKLFNDIIKKLPEPTMSLVEEKMFAVIKSGRLKTQVALKDGSAFPYPTKPQGDPVIVSLPGNALSSCINFVSYAVSHDETRKILTGILLEVTKDRLRTVALDGFRMAIKDAPVEYDGPDVSVILPKDGALEMSRLLTSDEKADLVLAENTLSLRIGDVELTTLLIAGKYISYESLLPKDATTNVLIDRRGFYGCVERAQIIAREGKNNLIKMAVDAEKLSIQSNADNGALYEEMDCSLCGDPISVAFNCQYMMDALKVETDGRLELSLVSPSRPVLMRNVDSQSTMQLILPVVAR